MGDDGTYVDSSSKTLGGITNAIESHEGTEGSETMASGGITLAALSDDGPNVVGGNDLSGHGGGTL